MASTLGGVLLLACAIPANVTDSGTIIMIPALFPKLWLLIGVGLLLAAVGGSVPGVRARPRRCASRSYRALTLAPTAGLRPMGFPLTPKPFMAAIALMVRERWPAWLLTAVVAVPLGLWLDRDAGVAAVVTGGGGGS
jgi:hypothetical protein